MPINAENKARYPKNWKAISRRIRFERAGGRCECVGECGQHQVRCGWTHGAMKTVSISHADSIEFKQVKIVLTTAHRVPDIEDCSDENLFAACQSCHLNYDAKLHAHNARRTRDAKAGQQRMWE